jgi:hypothetical protein
MTDNVRPSYHISIKDPLFFFHFLSVRPPRVLTPQRGCRISARNWDRVLASEWFPINCLSGCCGRDCRNLVVYRRTRQSGSLAGHRLEPDFAKLSYRGNSVGPRHVYGVVAPPGPSDDCDHRFSLAYVMITIRLEKDRRSVEVKECVVVEGPNSGEVLGLTGDWLRSK